MHTLKRFIQYYAPYKAVFFLRSCLCSDNQLGGSGFSSDFTDTYEDVVCGKCVFNYAQSCTDWDCVVLDCMFFRHVVNIMSAIRGI